MQYGFPFCGSKSRIAKDIIELLPRAHTFYDLFAGGCGITHAALLSNKWEAIIANDIQDTCSLFTRAIKGEFKDEKRWISREEFHSQKGNDPYIRWIWSFGNNGRSYMFGKKIEDIKKEAHEFLFKNGYDYTTKTRLALIKKFKEKNKLKKRFRLQQLEQLGRLEQLQQLERLQQLKTSKKDYKEVNIKKNSVVYCDIPYKQKQESNEKNYYGVPFDTKDFYTWAKTRDFPVYFSSCFCDDPDFICIWQKEKKSLMVNKNSHGKKTIIEKLFFNGVKLKK